MADYCDIRGWDIRPLHPQVHSQLLVLNEPNATILVEWKNQLLIPQVTGSACDLLGIQCRDYGTKEARHLATFEKSGCIFEVILATDSVTGDIIFGVRLCELNEEVTRHDYEKIRDEFLKKFVEIMDKTPGMFC